MSIATLVRRIKHWKRSSWHDVRWLVVGIVIATGLVLGWIGLREFAEQQGRDVTSSDILYDDFRLLLFGSFPGPNVPWQLDIARFLLPGAAGYSAYAAIAALFRDRILVLRARALSGHTIVTGLGGKGLPLVLSLREAGRKVVAIELDPASPGLAPAREAGAIIIVGDASDARTLQSAGAEHAGYLVTAADDAANAEVALGALAIVREQSDPPLRCIVYLVDPDLSQLLQRDALASASRRRVQIEFVNLHDQAAQLMLAAFAGKGQRVAVIGTGVTAERLVVRAANDAANERGVLLAGDGAPALYEKLSAKHEWLAPRVDPVDCVLDAPVRLASQLFDEHGPVTVFVCLDDQNETLEVALALREPARRHRCTVVAALSRPGALAQVVDRANEGKGDEALRAVSLADLVCTADFMTRGVLEQMARAAHETWLEQYGDAGARGVPPNVPWDDLPEGWREANRDQAAHAGEKLEAIGCRIVVSDDPHHSDFAYTDDEVEVLARREHDRWVAEKVRTGWRLGPRDDAKRTHPDLVDWAELEEPDREKDRAPVREIPHWLLRAGFDIERANPSEGGSPTPA